MSQTALKSNKEIRHVDAVVIGAGTAGHNAYRQISKATNNVLIINEGIWSTTCIYMGCMPSKLLIAAADRAYHANHSDEFGVEGRAIINGEQVMKRVRSERDHFASYALKNVESWDENNKISGRAVITESGLIEAHTATGETLYIKADHIIVATGSKPSVPEGWKLSLGDALITSDTIFELADLPKSMAVVGAGAIGLELAQAMSRLEVEVVIFNRSDIVGGIKDEAINQKAISCFSKQLDLRINTRIDSVSREENKDDVHAVIDYTDADGNSKTWRGEKVLVATGRHNTLDTLGLEHVGVKLDDKNRPLNMNRITGKIEGTKVYVVGDANAYMPLLHVSSNEGYLSGKEVALKISGLADKISMSDAIAKDTDCANDSNMLNDMSPDKSKTATTPMSVIFTSPQIMTIGQSLPEIENDGRPYVIGEVSFDNQGRSRVMGVNCGLLHIYACPDTQLILGASMVGPDAEYIAHILATAITNKVDIEGLLASPFYHPTILEGLRTALRDTVSKIDKYNA
ncbi:dihydrolipoyl dehydrogenase [Psychrobacter sp.]|uniref:dihydrolipoyl dehydrogenase n=1 Tax=Psychrobacter sp. TaxID=56811 RepID=UPI0025ED383B|nr:dihydrolipoyl dehydrogenase [Psychrobacter sp.]